jgi:hypothetical protein
MKVAHSSLEHDEALSQIRHVSQVDRIRIYLPPSMTVDQNADAPVFVRKGKARQCEHAPSPLCVVVEARLIERLERDA